MQEPPNLGFAPWETRNASYYLPSRTLDLEIGDLNELLHTLTYTQNLTIEVTTANGTLTYRNSEISGDTVCRFRLPSNFSCAPSLVSVLFDDYVLVNTHLLYASTPTITILTDTTTSTASTSTTVWASPLLELLTFSGAVGVACVVLFFVIKKGRSR